MKRNVTLKEAIDNGYQIIEAPARKLAIGKKGQLLFFTHGNNFPINIWWSQYQALKNAIQTIDKYIEDHLNILMVKVEDGMIEEVVPEPKEDEDEL